MKKLVFILLLFNCKGRTPDSVEPVYPIDAVLLPFLEKFYYEGEKRGRLDLKTVKFSLQIKEGLLQDKNWNGVTYVYVNHCEIFIDAGILTWPYSRALWVTFHEFGHAILKREHCNPCDSIMNNDLPLRDLTPDIYDRYLDELFKP